MECSDDPLQCRVLMSTAKGLFFFLEGMFFYYFSLKISGNILEMLLMFELFVNKLLLVSCKKIVNTKLKIALKDPTPSPYSGIQQNLKLKI